MATDVLFTTFGSLGDVYPYLAIGKELLARGISVAMATSLYHKDLVEKSGLRFFHARPDLESDEARAQEIVKKIMDQRNGSEYVLRELIMPAVQDMYEDYYAASEDASLIITHPLTYGAIACARKRELPWIATVLSPANMWSAYDPPEMPKAPMLPLLRQLFGPGVSSALIGMAKKATHPWAGPYRKLQSQLGLSVIQGNPFFEGQFSPIKNLALFSPLFAAPQPDWPSNTVATGFPFIDEFDLKKIEDITLKAFLKSGPPPVVFTLGSSAVWDAGTFFVDSVEATRRLNMRAVLLVGTAHHTEVPNTRGSDVISFPFIPHSQIFPHAAIVVHQGGIGTTAQALRAGKPQVVMPYSHDQFDNAKRVVSLNAGVRISRTKYSGVSAANMLTRALEKSRVDSAAEIGEAIRSEQGARRAAEEIIAVLKS